MNVSIRMTSICGGGNHGHFDLTKGGQTRNVQINTDEVRSAPSQDDVEAFCRVAIKLLGEGKTAGQLKTALLAGFTVVVS